MKSKWVRYLIELSLVTVMVGGIELAWMKYEPTYAAPNKVLGMATSKEAQTEITAEISRLEGLLGAYPTYPPLLSQLAKLYRLVGNNELAEKYESELVRLNAKTP